MTNLTSPEAPSTLARLIVCGKGCQEGVAWLTPRWYEKIVAYQQVRPESTEVTLFLNQRGKPITVNGIQYRLRQHCSQAELRITCHQFRHTLARRLANRRMPNGSISKLLGHQDIETTQLYTAGADPDLQQEFEPLMEEQPLPAPKLSTTPQAQAPRPPRQR